MLCNEDRDWSKVLMILTRMITEDSSTRSSLQVLFGTLTGKINLSWVHLLLLLLQQHSAR